MILHCLMESSCFFSVLKVDLLWGRYNTCQHANEENNKFILKYCVNRSETVLWLYG